MPNSELSDSQSTSISSISSLLSEAGNFNLVVGQNIPRALKPVPRGSNIQWLKPAVKTGLYTTLINNYNNVVPVVQALISEIETNFYKVHNLLQIIPDLLLVNYEICDYSSQQYEVIIGQEFETAALRQENIQHRDIIFNHESNYAKALSNLVDLFLWHLCKQLTMNTQILQLSKKIFRVLLSFLRHMGKSEVIAIRLTAFTFAFRINKFLSLRMLQLASEDVIVNEERATLLFDSISDIMKTYQIDAIYTGRQNIGAFQSFYLEFTQHFSLCVRVNASYFVNEKNLSFLVDLLKLRHELIVQRVIEICILLSHHHDMPTIHEMEPFKALLDGIYERLNHHDDRISFLASCFFTNVFRLRIDNLQERNIHRLLIRSYSLNLKLAQQCGHAIANYLHSFTYDNVTCYQIIIQLADKFCEDTHGKAERVKFSYLVESLYKYLKPLNLTSVYTVLTKSTALAALEYQSLVEIMYHLCCLNINGKVTIQRVRNPKDTVLLQSNDANTSIMTLLLTGFSVLLKKPHFDDISMIWMLKTLALIKYDKREVYQFKNYVTDIVTKVLKYFDSNNINQCDLWGAITLFIQKAACINGGDAYLVQLEHTLLVCVKTYQNYIHRFEKNNTIDSQLMVELKLQIVCELLKIKAILASGILPTHLDLGLFYRYWINTQLPDEIIKEQILCSAFLFANHVKVILKPEGSEVEITPEFVKHLKMDAMSLWFSLDSLFQVNANMRSTIFEAMAILIGHYANLLTVKSLSENPHLKSAFFNYWDSSSNMKEIFTFFYEVCFINSHDVDNKLPLSVRRNYLDLFFPLYYQSGQAVHESNHYVFVVVGHYEKFYKHYSSCYQRFFEAVIDKSEEEFYWLICKTFCTIEQDTQHYNKQINLDELAILFANPLSDVQKVALVRYLVNQSDDKNSVKKYLNSFLVNLPKTKRLKLNEYIEKRLADIGNTSSE